MEPSPKSVDACANCDNYLTFAPTPPVQGFQINEEIRGLIYPDIYLAYKLGEGRMIGPYEVLDVECQYCRSQLGWLMVKVGEEWKHLLPPGSFLLRWDRIVHLIQPGLPGEQRLYYSPQQQPGTDI